jgi:hypothetical protein
MPFHEGQLAACHFPLEDRAILDLDASPDGAASASGQPASADAGATSTSKAPATET